MSDEEEVAKPPERGMPAWVMTFADLMSLLMCFFVLLLSFSEMDLQKFKQVAGSMERAFGVQRQVRAKESPRGTSIIAQEFSPGKPEPTPINEVKQSTTEDLESLLKVEGKAIEVTTEGMAKSIAKEIIEEIRDGQVEVDNKSEQILIRILEKGSFSSGSATLKKAFLPTIQKIGDVLASTPGKIIVSGHTDNIPIQNDLFRSNWELSAARSFAVISELLKNKKLKSERFVLVGNADTKPLEKNDTPENRARNRRVELEIIQGEEDPIDEEKVIQVDEDSTELDKLLKPDDLDLVEPTFRPSLEITTDGTENYLGKESDLGIFDEDALYNYELKDIVIPKSDDQDENP